MSANQMRFREWYGYDTFMGRRQVRKLGNNTYCVRRVGVEHDYFEVTYHGSVIVRCMFDWISYYNRGYETASTKVRLNDMLPDGYRVYQKDWIWYLWDRVTGVSKVWEDGITLAPDSSRWVRIYSYRE